MLNEKVIVVTGGGGLLGGHFCRAIAAQGGIAIVADVNLDAAQSIVATINTNNGRAQAVALDITDADSVERVIASLHAVYGRIDAVINNAYPRNARWGKKLEEVTYADFCENVGLHLGGYFLVAQKFALYFRAHGGGNIVNMASIYGTQAPRFDIYADTGMTMPVEYAAIKAAIIQLTKYFAQYFKTDNIRCNSLSPGGVLNHQPETFLKKYSDYCGSKGMLEPDDIIGALLFLLSDSSRYMNGQNLIVDDGFCL
ncbi:MAG: Flagellin modification protein [Verrucomicrobiaceae bacterium]|nr:Flagellin modification protein [Verrucomicrobiaceae bacterium]